MASHTNLYWLWKREDSRQACQQPHKQSLAPTQSNVRNACPALHARGRWRRHTCDPIIAARRRAGTVPRAKRAKRQGTMAEAEGGTGRLEESGRSDGCCGVATPVQAPVWRFRGERPILRTAVRARDPGPGRLGMEGGTT